MTGQLGQAFILARDFVGIFPKGSDDMSQDSGRYYKNYHCLVEFIDISTNSKLSRCCGTFWPTFIVGIQ